MKFYIETYGCQMNLADSELVTGILINKGFSHVSDINDADVIIFNTCSVRQHAEDRVLGRISNEFRRKKTKPELKIGVIGCMAQRIGEQLIKEGRKIDFAVGVDQYDKLEEIIKNQSSYCNDFDETQLYDDLLPKHNNSVCGYVTIMRGCNNYCSYCIVPYVRGNERSRSPESILSGIQAAVKLGVKDITLLGQNVNSYKYEDITFAKLLKQVNLMDGLHRIRFITSHPKDLSDELIQAMSECDKVCEHIHLPMQSGDNTVLTRMNRKYSIEHYLELITKLRKQIPGISITTDLIAGFPEETEEQFENTIRAMKIIEFDYAFCFKYSNREGTKAADFTNQVDENLRLHRLQKLIRIQRQITDRKFKSKIGSIVEVLVEGKSRQAGDQLSGKTRDYKICAFDGSDSQIGSLVKVKIKTATAGTLVGDQELYRLR